MGSLLLNGCGDNTDVNTITGTNAGPNGGPSAGGNGGPGGGGGGGAPATGRVALEEFGGGPLLVQTAQQSSASVSATGNSLPRSAPGTLS